MKIVIENTITAYPKDDSKFKVYFYLIGEGIIPDKIYVKDNNGVSEVNYFTENMPLIDPGELTQYYVEVSPTVARPNITVSLSLDSKNWTDPVIYRPTDLTAIKLDTYDLLLSNAACVVSANKSTLGDELTYCVFSLYHEGEKIKTSSRIYSPFRYELKDLYNNAYSSYKLRILFATKLGYIA